MDERSKAQLGRPFGARDFRHALSQFCSGIVIVTGGSRQQPYGFTAQSFMSVSLEPPLIAVCPSRESASWPLIRAGRVFTINVLAEDQRELSRRFASASEDRFAEVDWSAGESGTPVLAGVLGHIDCELWAEHDAGDHFLALGHVLGLSVRNQGRGPLLYFRSDYGGFAQS
ncbi:MAG: flavin reductase family protein [Steroidobacteraceae bacterium]